MIVNVESFHVIQTAQLPGVGNYYTAQSQDIVCVQCACMHAYVRGRRCMLAKLFVVIVILHCALCGATSQVFLFCLSSQLDGQALIYDVCICIAAIYIRAQPASIHTTSTNIWDCNLYETSNQIILYTVPGKPSSIGLIHTLTNTRTHRIGLHPVTSRVHLIMWRSSGNYVADDK